MGIIKYIAAIILSAVTLTSFTGVLLYKDVCIPCGSSQVYIYADFSEPTCNCDEAGTVCTECCNIETKHTKNHTHNHEVIFKKLSNYFLVSTPKQIAKPYAKAVILFSFETTATLFSPVTKIAETAKLPPGFDIQSFVCVLLI